MTITPDQARYLLAGATPGPWHKCRDNHSDCDCPEGTVFGPDVVGSENPGIWWTTADEPVILAAPDLAQTIAGMTEEWKAEYREIWGAWLAVSDWTTEDKARLALIPDQFKDATTRLVRRLVGPVEAVE